MAYPELKYSKNRINHAGHILSKYISTAGKKFEEEERIALSILNNFRACHAYPINTFQATLRNKVNRITTKALVAQRLKRLPSIVLKLNRLNNMQLSRMQDIGGLRVVLPTLKQVRLLESDYLRSRFMHKLHLSRDYILNPKDSGYRSIHLVYKYKNTSNSKYDGLFIELQIRTRLQHAWATAVETMGTYLKYSLKSSEGPQRWLDFFAITGTAFAYIEDTPPTSKYKDLSKEQICKMVSMQETELEVINKLATFNVATQQVSTDSKRGTYHLIILDYNNKKVTIKSYRKEELAKANNDYSAVERQVSLLNPLEVVLVSTGSIKKLKKAYPNYFLDTEDFIEQLKKIQGIASNSLLPTPPSLVA